MKSLLILHHTRSRTSKGLTSVNLSAFKCIFLRVVYCFIDFFFLFNKCVNEAWGGGGSSVSVMVGVFKEMHMCVVAAFVDHHSFFLRRLGEKEQGFLQAPEKRTCLCWGAEVRIVQSNLRHMECFHGGQKDDLLKDTIKLKNAERRREEERCCTVSGGITAG